MAHLSQEVTVVPYIIDQWGSRLTLLEQGNILTTTVQLYDDNQLGAAMRLMMMKLNIFDLTEEDWDTYKAQKDKRLCGVSRHFADHAFFISESIICIPMPGQLFHDFLPDSIPDSPLFENHYKIA